MKSRLSTILKKGVHETFHSSCVLQLDKWYLAMDAFRDLTQHTLTTGRVDFYIRETLECLDSIYYTKPE